MVPTEALRGTEPIVVSNNATYNYAQFDELFKDIGADVCNLMISFFFNFSLLKIKNF